MQPELSPGQRSFEQAPAPQVDSYEVPQNFSSPENSQEGSFERVEQRSAVELAPPPPVATVSAAVLQQTAAPAPLAQSTHNPVAANDDDTIEKEWVDRAKQVIAQTKDNPYAREKAIAELQRDYLMKRYGRQIGTSND